MKTRGKKLVSEGVFISGMSLLSKGMGVIREVALAYFFGTSKLVDAYRISMSGVFLLFLLLKIYGQIIEKNCSGFWLTSYLFC